MCYYSYETEIGTIYIAFAGGKIVGIDFSHQRFVGFEYCEVPQIYEAFKEIEQYLQGQRREFDMEIDYKTTPFNTTVYEELKKVGFGETISYAELAKRANSDKAARAVGNAVNRNPLAIVIPCHRVVGSNGALVGYRGGLEIKKHLLDLEKQKG